MSPFISKDLLRSFGRVKRRKLTDKQQYLIDNVLKDYSIEIPSPVLGVGLGLFPEKKSLCLEIGFGGGEHLAQMAINNPDIGFIGCEPFTNGVANLLDHIKTNNIENIKVFFGDARLLIEQMPEKSLKRIFVLFPDPWPKAKHHKKRLLQTKFIDNIALLLEDGGVIEIATDHVEYAEWIAGHIAQCVNVFEEQRDRTKPFIDWVETKYQQKARKQGREAVFYRLVRK